MIEASLLGSSASTTQTSFQVTSFQSFESSSTGKYGGLIHKSWFKNLSSDLVQCLAYVYAEVPTFPLLHTVISVLRLLQLCGPALLPSFTTIWNVNTTAYSTVSLISVFFRFIPANLQDQLTDYVLAVFCGMSLLYISLMVYSAKVFKRQAYLPKGLTFTISYYTAVFGQILTPFALSFVGKEIFSLPEKSFTSIALVALSFAIVIPLLWFNLTVSSQSLTFRYSSLMTITNTPQTYITLCTNFIGFLLPMASNMGRLPQIICVAIVVVIYFFCSYVPNISGGFVDEWVSAVITSTSIISAISCMSGLFFLFSGQEVTLVALFVLILGHGVLIFANLLWQKRSNIKSLIFLDNIFEDKEAFALIKSKNEFMLLAKLGFRTAHPITLDWTLFKIFVNQNPDEPDIWLMWSKFVAIYPEEMQTLLWIFQTVIHSKLKGQAVRCIKQQCISIARMREPNLSPDLKNKLNDLHKLLQTTKHKLARVWDVAIQGNISEIESSAKAFLEMRKKNEALYDHMLRQFPNNRFVTRAYAHFESEIMSDQLETRKMLEKTRLLQRGVQVNRDQTHELGCCAFPMIPEVLKVKTNIVPDNVSDVSITLLEDPTIDESIKVEQSDQVRKLINNLSIPAVRRSYISRFFLILIITLAILITTLIFIKYYLNVLMEPLDFLKSVVNLGTISTIITQISHRYIFQKLGVYEPSEPTNGDNRMTSFYNSWEGHLMLKYMIGQLNVIAHMVDPYLNWKSGNVYADELTRIIFRDGINFTTFQSPTQFTTTPTSVLSAAIDYVVHQTALTDENYVFTPSIVDTPIVLNPLCNSYKMIRSVNEAIDQMILYVSQVDSNTKTVAKYLLISAVLLTSIPYFAAMWHEIVDLKGSKEETYRSIAVLPKNAVSALSENLRVYKQTASSNNQSTSQSEEFSKRDESIIKIFNTGITSSAGYLDVVIISICTIIIVACNVISIYLLYELIISISSSIKESAPQLTNLHGSYSATQYAVILLNAMTLVTTPHWRPVMETFNFETDFNTILPKAAQFWRSVTLNFDEVRNNVNSVFVCNDRKELFSQRREVLCCFYADHIYEAINVYLEEYYVQVKEGGATFDPMNPVFGRCHDFMTYPIFDIFFIPMFTSVIPKIQAMQETQLNNTYPIVITLIVISCLMEIIILFQIKSIDLHIRDVLSLLLHHNPAIVLQIPKVVDILHGNFTRTKNDFTTRSREFFDDVFKDLPDAVFVTENDVVETYNSSYTRLFNPTGNAIPAGLQKFCSSKGESTEIITYQKDDGSTMYLQLTSVLHNQKHVVTARDVTTITRYNTLISEEKQRSDRLLASIIPASLVERVQSGEKNISFAVQSASIIFLDIVEFTPWCSSIPSAKVMSTLNHLYSLLDGLVAKYSTLTRVKCIGDCYMAAGGIFSEINQPSEHARDAVSFALDAIDAVNTLNAETGESLKLRIGINTGGPLVGGVLGIGKPTFEIFGPVINMAQQMEHSGVPMAVQISRPVYELVYGEHFKIKERGAIEVKGGSVLAYLVHRN